MRPKRVSASADTRVHGLDSIRFWAAMWVVCSHFGGLNLTAGIDRTHWLGYAVSAFGGIIVNGPAAVIVFFIVSGFCIHYPYASGTAFHPLQFLTQRFIRIGLPLLAAIAFSETLGIEFHIFEQTILWSLFAELIYYSIYPLIRIVIRKCRWSTILICAYILALLVVATNPEAATRSINDPAAGDYPNYGLTGNWLLGLPCWLLGVRLAESKSDSRNKWAGNGIVRIWPWRLFIWGLSAVCLVLRFHSPIGYPWTLNVFAIVAYFWIGREISYYSQFRPRPLFEWGGKWSYSIYLVHGIAWSIFHFFLPFPKLGIYVDWIFQMTFILLFSYAFFNLMERPAHAIARYSGRLMVPKNQIVG